MIHFAFQDNAPGISVAMALVALLLHLSAAIYAFVPRGPSRGQKGAGDLMTTESFSQPVGSQLAAPAPVTPAASRVGVEFKGVQRHFGAVTALQGLDMEIHPVSWSRCWARRVAARPPRSGCWPASTGRMPAAITRRRARRHQGSSAQAGHGHGLSGLQPVPEHVGRQNVAFGLRMRGRARRTG